jgi:hypothetical protein
LAATLRLDPCPGLGVTANTTLWNGVKVYGDVYAKSDLVNNGMIGGDVFAPSLTGIGSRTGQLNPQPLSLAWPPVTAGYKNVDYPIRFTAALPAGTYTPASVWYCFGNLSISGIVRISGMLLVTGNLTISNNASLNITAAQGLPALYVGGTLNAGSASVLQIQGLAVVGLNLCVSPTASTITFDGGLFLGGTLDPSGLGASVTIVADPLKAAIVAWNMGVPTCWSPAAGSFYKSIRRQ